MPDARKPSQSMYREHPIILLLEDCPGAGDLIERAVLKALPECRLLWARTIEEATRRAEGLNIHLFLVDIGLPDGSGMDFLWQMSISHPKARAIVITATPLPEHQENSAALGVLHFIAKPLKIPLFLEQLREALQTDRVNGSGKDFRATLENLRPADILQLKCLTGTSAVVEFRSRGQIGSIRFDQGEVADAEAGHLRGLEAVIEILGWNHGEVSERPCSGRFVRTIRMPWQTLLMDASHRLDERSAAA